MLNEFLVLLSSSSAESSIWMPPAIGGATAGGIYWGIYRYYRNVDKRYKFEHETKVEIENMKKTDRKTGRNNGTSNRYVRGRNSDNHLSRL